MYQFQLRRGAVSGPIFWGRKSRQYCSSVDIKHFFLRSFLFPNRRPQAIAIAATLCAPAAFLAGCGGMTFNNAGAGSNNSLASLVQISCGTQSLTGAQTKTCSVTLSGPAGRAMTVSLQSSSSALTVPASVQIAAGTTSVNFSATSSSVSKAVSVTITGAVAGVSKTAVLTVYPAAVPPVTLSKVSCNSQSLSSAGTASCTVSLSGPAVSATSVNLSTSSSDLKIPSAVTVPAGSSTAAFSITAASVISSENVTLSASFGGITQTQTIQLLGAGAPSQTQHKVQLSWSFPNDAADPIVAFRVYRSNTGTSSYAQLVSLSGQTTYTDATVQSGMTYDYAVTSLDGSGNESPFSNTSTVTIP